MLKDTMEENHVCFIDIPNNNNNNKSRSISPLTPSPRYEKNLGFFQALSRRFGRRSHDDMMMYRRENDSRSSSTDSCSSSTTGHLLQQISKDTNNTSHIHNSTFELSNYENSSEASSTTDDHINDKMNVSVSNMKHRRLHRRSTSSIRRALQSLSLSTRSLSCSNTTTSSSSPLSSSVSSVKEQKRITDNKLKKANTNRAKQQQQQQPQRILRQPVSYTYLKGMSGLPTQRVPRSSVCCHYAHR